MSKKQNTLINGIAYNYVDMSVSFAGITVPAYAQGIVGIPVKNISYDATQSKTANYEYSKYATSYSYGKIEYKGTMTFTLDSLEFLRDRIFELFSGSRTILDLPACDVTITFANKGKINVHTLKNVIFTSEKTSGSEGDATFSVACDFLCSFINYGDPSALGLVAVTAAVVKEASGDNQVTL